MVLVPSASPLPSSLRCWGSLCAGVIFGTRLFRSFDCVFWQSCLIPARSVRSCVQSFQIYCLPSAMPAKILWKSHCRNRAHFHCFGCNPQFRDSEHHCATCLNQSAHTSEIRVFTSLFTLGACPAFGCIAVDIIHGLCPMLTMSSVYCLASVEKVIPNSSGRHEGNSLAEALCA